jgi:hypothetical protein
MDRDKLLQMINPMLAGFKLEIAKMRSDGATQADIDLMLDEFEEAYAPDNDVKESSFWQSSDKLRGCPTNGSQPEKHSPGLRRREILA